MGVLLDLQHILQPCLLQNAESHYVGVLCCSTAKYLLFLSPILLCAGPETVCGGSCCSRVQL